jgi:hypothetical protein
MSRRWPALCLGVAVVIGWAAGVGDDVALASRESACVDCVGGSQAGLPSVAEVLRKAREARGGMELDGVKSLLIRMTRTLTDAMPSYETVRFLAPDRFQVVRSTIFTIVGERFWRRPAGTSETLKVSERNTRARFAEYSVLFLLTVPASVAAADTVARRGDGELLATWVRPGHTPFTLVLDARSFAVRAIEEEGLLSQAGEYRRVLRRVTIDTLRRVGGIRAPAHMTESIGGSTAKIQVTDVLVNAGVTEADFEEPKGLGLR